ncbi:tetratricopeptide repeat protein [Treponema endosymbiont of Eucomonympha sp.]|uniref:tetratricopeptide repeat protein n=1 Tax=Treponema endosymbiont of Eucomonympha sp. TaxID=1580831 RepID=UPI0007510130|nr:tetratricopeptide repeat protein [Treponema endosymbiont of Eucomonympha sp.]
MTSENADLLNEQAIGLASNGNFPEAIACFRRAISMERSNYLFWYNLGVTYRDSGCLTEAKSALECADMLSEGDDEVLESLSLVCYALGETEKAFEYCQSGLDLNEDNERLWNNLGVLFFVGGEYEDACEAFEAAVTLDPCYGDALFNLRDAYSELGNKSGETECARRLSELEARGAQLA